MTKDGWRYFNGDYYNGDINDTYYKGDYYNGRMTTFYVGDCWCHNGDYYKGESTVLL